jgi:hypothetical protein
MAQVLVVGKGMQVMLKVLFLPVARAALCGGHFVL